MNARERAGKIGYAAKKERDRITWGASGKSLASSSEFYESIGVAAVRAAYEIDGVRELIEKAEMAVGSDMALNVKANPFNDEVLAAAARVREAIGGQT